MRAVNTVIQAAGILKKNEGPDAAEDLLMLRAIRDSNLSKFLKNDVVLFGSIIKDLFPGVAEPKVEYAALEKELLDVTKESGLQPAPEFLVKCIQLYEMTVVRHGMMLVGPTGGGKSRILRTLQAAMSRVKDDPAFERVRVYRCNPKAISMNQLYGAFDEQTGEWTDGIAAVLIRHISQPNLEETGVTDANIKWMAFDGPVDALWIENMNTVLDDNKKLCLNSGEIIPLSETNTIMFEVEDLAVASPATVSRNGMIYVEPPWSLPDRLDPTNASKTPLITSWLDALPPLLTPSRDGLAKLIDNYLVPCTELVRLQLYQPVAAAPSNLVAALLRMLEALLLPYWPQKDGSGNNVELDEAGEAREAALTEAAPKILEPTFFMALTWSVGGTCDAAGRLKFDELVRSLASEKGGVKGLPAGAGVSLYDCVYDAEKKLWVPWMKTVTAPPRPPAARCAAPAPLTPPAAPLSLPQMVPHRPHTHPRMPPPTRPRIPHPPPPPHPTRSRTTRSTSRPTSRPTSTRSSSPPPPRCATPPSSARSSRRTCTSSSSGRRARPSR